MVKFPIIKTWRVRTTLV